MSDENFFSGYSLSEVHDWYLDLANAISHLSGAQSTAPKLLEYYLSPNKQKRNEKIINFCKNEIEGKRKKDGTPNYFGIYTNKNAGVYEEMNDNYLKKIKQYTEYRTVMKEMLDIFLSKKDKSKGIISHIKSEGLKHEYALYYYKSCGFKSETKGNLLKVAEKINSNYILEKLTADELDVYVGLNTFGLKAEVTISIDGKNMFDEIKRHKGQILKA